MMSRNGRNAAKASRVFGYIVGTVAIVALVLIVGANWDAITDLFKSSEEAIESTSPAAAALLPFKFKLGL